LFISVASGLGTEEVSDAEHDCSANLHEGIVPRLGDRPHV
jgi:hypothetical protein